jgi:hypothetical protein
MASSRGDEVEAGATRKNPVRDVMARSVRLRVDASPITVAYGRPIYAMIAGRTFSSIGKAGDHLLETLVAEGAGFGSILEEEAAAS